MQRGRARAGAESGKELEEALAYVALSRAKQRVTHVARTAAGEPALPSRFLSEVPTALANQRMASTTRLVSAFYSRWSEVPRDLGPHHQR